MTRDDVKKVLRTLRVNFSKSFSGMSIEDREEYLDIWERGLKRIDDRYIWEALDYFLCEYTEAFSPTLGQFLEKANQFRIQYERKNPVIRNAWEVEDDVSE